MLEPEKEIVEKKSICYNCQTEIIDPAQKYCPNCQVILDPNGYIKWKLSFYGFMGFICLSPILFAFLIFFL